MRRLGEGDMGGGWDPVPALSSPKKIMVSGLSTAVPSDLIDAHGISQIRSSGYVWYKRN